MDSGGSSDPRRSQHGTPGPRSVSPRTVARRMHRILSADPSSTVTSNLGARSTSHPNVSFTEGGGFTARTRVARTMSAAEIQQEHQEKLAKWEQHGSRGNEPQPRSATKPVTEFEGDVEYHPPGGIHSNYNPALDERIGGSYLRVKTAVPARPTEQRYGRHGAFSNDETFDKQPLDPSARKRAGRAQIAPVGRSESPPPSPRAARALTQRLYQDPQHLMSELATGRSYSELAGGASTSTSTGAAAAAAAAAASSMRPPSPVGIRALNPQADPVYHPPRGAPPSNFGPVGSGRPSKK